MKNVCLLLLGVFGMAVAAGFADEPKSDRIALTKSKTGTAEIELPARVESADRKFDKTEIHSRETNGARQITEIRIGGTSLRIAVEHGS